MNILSGEGDGYYIFSIVCVWFYFVSFYHGSKHNIPEMFSVIAIMLKKWISSKKLANYIKNWKIWEFKYFFILWYLILN